MDLGKGVSVSKDKESNLVLTVKNGKTEKLPRNTKDRDGNAVYLVYKKLTMDMISKYITKYKMKVGLNVH